MARNTGFAGFPEEALRFFRSLDRNNRREWFQPRKQIFDEKVRAPMIELVEAINLGLARFAPEYVTGPEQAVYRIYRDTRFSADKTPYKTHIAASFWRRGYQKHSCAGFYLSVSHKEVEVAGGVYMPGPEQLLDVRRHIAGHHEEFRKLTNNRKLVALMEPLKGDSLSRIPKGFSAGHSAAGLLRMKQWLYYTMLEPTIATTPELYEALMARLRAMQPVVDFLNQPLARSKPKLDMAQWRRA
jgi:uncharacterized protein (TIGR02453 family)